MWPATLEALHVYEPACFPDTESMLKIVVRRPNIAVDMSVRSGLIGWPLWIQVSFRGRSPWETEHFRVGASPALKASSPNEKGSILGATAANKKLLKTRTVHDELSGELRLAGDVGCPASVESCMATGNGIDTQDSRSFAEHRCGDVGAVWADGFPVEQPRKSERKIAFGYGTLERGRLAHAERFVAKRERNHFRRH